jgi:NDP-4-keto-2,6-dideoxyhexose 3-C-methyltransferase
MSDYIPIRNCRVCNSQTNLIKDFGPMALTCVFPKEDEQPPIIPMTVRHCPKCRLVQLGENTKPDLMYKEGYGYRSGVNESMVGHLDKIVHLASQFVEDGDAVLDIGCNDGTLLKLWKKHARVYRVGVDPVAFEDIDASLFIQGYFSISALHDFKSKFNVVTSIAMFYDLPDPIAFARDVWQVLKDGGVWILEVGYAGAIQAGYWDGLIHEHLEYYGLQQIARIANLTGFRLAHFEFNDTNGGSLLCLLEKCNAGEKVSHAPGMREVIEREMRWDWDDLDAMVRMSAKNIRHAIQGYRIYVLGASSKGNVLLQTIWANPSLIPYAIERNPDKFGRRTPGSNIPIMSEEFAREHPPQMFLVLPYHFRENILERYKDFREKGVKFLFPLPNPEII